MKRGDSSESVSKDIHIFKIYIKIFLWLDILSWNFSWAFQIGLGENCWFIPIYLTMIKEGFGLTHYSKSVFQEPNIRIQILGKVCKSENFSVAFPAVICTFVLL